MTRCAEIQAEVGRWCRANFGERSALADALIVAEEAGEVARAVLKRSHGQRPETDWDAQLRLEVGDVVIALLSLAHNEGFDLMEAATERWAEVRLRHPGPGCRP